MRRGYVKNTTNNATNNIARIDNLITTRYKYIIHVIIMNEESVITIKQWLDVENKIAEHSAILRELRKEKKQLNVSILEIMKANDIDCFDCNSGQITYIRNNIKRGLNQKVLHELLGNYFNNQNANPNEAEKLCKYIQDHRGIEIRETIKLKKNKL